MAQWSDKRFPVYAAGVLLAVSCFCALMALGRHSLTYDAVKYPAAGYDYLHTGRVRFDPENPPIGKALMALPLMWMDIDAPVVAADGTQRGFFIGRQFFFENRVPARVLSFYARIPSVVAGALLGGMLFLLGRKRLGDRSALLALVFLLADPMYRALSTLATTDIFLALFFLSAMYCLDRSSEGKGKHWLVLAGICAAAGTLTKFSGLLFYPLAAAALFYRNGRRKGLRGCCVLAGILAAMVWGVYRAGMAQLWEGLSYQRTVLAHGPPFLFFFNVLENAAKPYYYLVSLILKTPIPFLAGLSVSAVLWWQSRERKSILLAAIPFLLFLAAASSNRFYATRYLFPVYPLLALVIGAGWKFGGKRARVLLCLLAVWQVGEAVWASPHYLSYLNLPWRTQGHRYLSNSDFDWGQDLPSLGSYLKEEGNPPLQLCYLGTADPKAWGIEAQELITVPGITRSERVLPLAPKRELLAVSAGCRQYMSVGLLDGREVRAWEWLDRRTPIAKIGDTISIYDIRMDIEAHGRIGQLHLTQKEYAKALREAKRIREINPHDAQGREFSEYVERESRGNLIK